MKIGFIVSEVLEQVKLNANYYKKPIKLHNRGNVKMVAHRGLSGLYRENTVRAFDEAAKMDYFGIETDVHCTADNKFVIIHDDNTGRVSDVNVSVEGSTLSQLQAIKIRPKRGVDSDDGTRIPQLFEYVDACKRGGKIGVLELKNHFEEQALSEVITIIKNMDYLDKMIFISFDWDNCVNARKLCPEVPVQLLCFAYSDDLPEKLKAAKLDVDIYYKIVTKNMVDAFHKAGVQVNCWTVDSRRRAEKLAAWGVDFITSNILL